VAPWYLALTVGLSYLASRGFAMLVFVHLSSADGLLFVLPLLMFIFSMAIGEDYNILVMIRIREEAELQASFREVVIHTVGITGTTVTSAGIILASGSGEDQQLGFSIAFGAALDTFFVRTLLVPATPCCWAAGTGGRSLFRRVERTAGETAKEGQNEVTQRP